MPLSEEPYLPYKVISHHLDSLKEGGYFISLIENDFFEKENNDIFKKEVEEKGYIFGLIKLSESLFKNNPKSILIIHKKSMNLRKSKDFLLVDLPSFNDIDAFNKIIIQIDSWIKKREDELL